MLVAFPVERTELNRIADHVSQLIVDQGLECIETLWLAHERTLQIFIDDRDRQKTITVDECATVSRLLNEDTSLDELFDSRYNLEVSSPGLERPLRLLRDFQDHLGKEVYVQLTGKVQDRRKSKGLLQAVETPTAGEPVVAVTTDGGTWTFGLHQVQKAHLLYDWNDGAGS